VLRIYLWRSMRVYERDPGGNVVAGPRPKNGLLYLCQ
jgi:hypothetical protein